MCLGVIVFVFLLRVSIVKRKAAAKYGKEPLTAAKANNSPSDKHDVGSHTRSPFLVVSSGDGKTRPKLKTNSTESIGAEVSERDPLILTNHTKDRNPRNEPQNGGWVFSKRLIVTKTLFKSTQILTSCLGIFILITVLTAFDAVLPIYVNKKFCPAFHRRWSDFLCHHYPSRLWSSGGGCIWPIWPPKGCPVWFRHRNTIDCSAGPRKT